MEQQFYRDEFEQLLKDTTDDFKMYPSRKVWHSIYNDLHPDRKWPSFAVCLLLLTTILYVGVSNNNAISNETKNTALIVSLKNNPQPTENTAQPAGKFMPASSNDKSQNSTLAVAEDAPVFPVLSLTNNSPEQPIIAEVVKVQNTNEADITSQRQQDIAKSDPENGATFITGANTKVLINATVPVTDEVASNDKSGDEIPEVANSLTPTVADNVAMPVDLKLNGSSLIAASNQFLKDTREREWIEDFAFYNKRPSANNLFKGLSTQFYVTPSVGYRIMFRNDNHKGIDNNSLVTNSAIRNEEDKVELNQQAAINMEAGAGITKDLGKRLRFKTGLQFNYTDYITYAQRLDHPTEANLVVGSQGPSGARVVSYSSGYAHIPGNNNSKLHNNTIQLSIPIGMDYKIINSRVLSWYVGAAVQPTFVTRSNSYLLSSDNNYFVDEEAMLRRWNLNGALETFVSFKTPGGTFINMGPQFRYQLFSSYSKTYSYTVKPYSIGFKIGFTRPL